MGGEPRLSRADARIAVAGRAMDVDVGREPVGVPLQGEVPRDGLRCRRRDENGVFDGSCTTGAPTNAGKRPSIESTPRE